LYRWVVTNYYNPAALKHATWEFTIFLISAVCTSVTVQTFFAHRVYSLSTNLYLGILVQVLVLVQFGFGVATGVIVNMKLDVGVVLGEYEWVPMSWLVIQAIADIVIATCMYLVLRHQRTGFQKTDSMVDRMILYTISTGLITSVLSCIILGMFTKYGLNVSVLTVSLPLSGLYSVTMLANLHTRKTLRARFDTPGLFELINSSMKMRTWRKAGGCGDEENHQCTRMNTVTEVGPYDVDVKTDVSSEHGCEVSVYQDSEPCFMGGGLNPNLKRSQWINSVEVRVGMCPIISWEHHSHYTVEMVWGVCPYLHYFIIENPTRSSREAGCPLK